MNVRRLFAAVVLFIFAAAISAQTYSVRVTYNTNLRTSYSLESAIIANARAGTTVLVVGSFGRWFEINRDGNEVWMANWVPYTRVEGQEAPSDIDNCCFVDRQCQSDTDWTNGYWAYQRNECSVTTAITQPTSAQPASSTPAQVDNCCFIDRQCNTDQEWAAGYWAYQNKQCGVGIASQTESSTRTPSSTPAQTDNCCFLGWQCRTDQEWTDGYWAYQDNQCAEPQPISSASLVIPADVDNCCRVNQQCATDEDWRRGWEAFIHLQCRMDVPISIEGGGGFRSQIHESLLLLQRTTPRWYEYTIRGLNKVVQTDSYENTYVDNYTKVFYLNYDDAWPSDYTRHEHLVFTASILVHEACHVHRHEAGLQSGGLPGELACTEAQLEAHIAIDPHDFRIDEHRETIANIHDPSTWWW